MGARGSLWRARRYGVFKDKVEHEKRNSMSTSNHVHKDTNNDVFDDFPKISDHFPKILQKLSKSHTNVSEYCPDRFEDLRR